ncbi:MAG TPA: hypothetical protein PLN21_17980 [Gemmatales bacterium]|nr:hypothetical protein [Gemmatales bacterium]
MWGGAFIAILTGLFPLYYAEVTTDFVKDGQNQRGGELAPRGIRALDMWEGNVVIWGSLFIASFLITLQSRRFMVFAIGLSAVMVLMCILILAKASPGYTVSYTYDGARQTFMSLGASFGAYLLLPACLACLAGCFLRARAVKLF